MRINSIRLSDYRNIDNLALDFDDVNIIWGENAQGKTNLIEAIYLFTGARSFRGANDSQLVRFGADQSRVAIDFNSNGRNQTAEITIKNKRSATLNGIKKKSPTALGEELKAVVFSPVHLSMIKDGPIERRRFVDNALCQIKGNYRNLLRDYNRALMQRNTLLKDMHGSAELGSMLYVWDDNLARTGAKIIYQRLKYIDAILPYAQDIFSGISGGRENIDIHYTGADDYTADIADIEKRLKFALGENRNNDVINRITTVGPHRDDIEITINGNSARTYGSQGQQRSCVLALKLAEASLLQELTDTLPIALLDDVMSELDERRQDYILNHIRDLQVFITCCDKETILRLKQGRTFHIENGGISGE